MAAEPVLILPGFACATGDYTSLLQKLEAAGLPGAILPVSRLDWAKVTQRTPGEEVPGYSWYLERVRAAVTSLKQTHRTRQVTIIAHSAGGWLAREFIGNPHWRSDTDSSTISTLPNAPIAAAGAAGTAGTAAAVSSSEEVGAAGAAGAAAVSSSEEVGAAAGTAGAAGAAAVSSSEEVGGRSKEFGSGTSTSVSGCGRRESKGPHPSVKMLVTLGTPQRPPPGFQMLTIDFAADGIPDATGGALTIVDRLYPGAYFSPALPYVCVTGDSAVGKRAPLWNVAQRFVNSSYERVCGKWEGIVGDGVVPNSYARLEGATNVVLHTGHGPAVLFFKSALPSCA